MTQEAIKDDHRAHPVASAWRPAIRAIVKRLAAGDDDLARDIPSVAPVSRAIASQIRAYLSEYGETLAELPDETWESSVAQWMGTHWDVVVDLWTIESGCSDLVLGARVFEVGDGFRIHVDWVHVP